MFEYIFYILGQKLANKDSETDLVAKEHYETVLEDYEATEDEAADFIESDQYEKFRQSRFTLSEEASLEETYDQFKEENDLGDMLEGE